MPSKRASTPMGGTVLGSDWAVAVAAGVNWLAKVIAQTTSKRPGMRTRLSASKDALPATRRMAHPIAIC